MKNTLLFLLLSSTFLYAEPEPNYSTLLSQSGGKNQNSIKPYQAKDYNHLIGMPGFDEKSLKMHFKLYNGYVNNTNTLLSLLNQYNSEGKDLTPQYAEIKRRLGWEFDGMRLHEEYFENLGGKESTLPTDSPLYKRIEKDFGSYDKWKEDFIATGMMRGIGWAILYLDPIVDRLMNVWVGEHDRGHLAGGEIILLMDVWEHAYLLDYGLDRMDYIRAFFNNVNWHVVQQRYKPEIQQKNLSRH